MTDFFKDQERWLNPYARLDRAPKRRNGRAGRFHLGMDALPRPDFHKAPRHVLEVFDRGIYPTTEVEGWTKIARDLPKQPQWWYTALALLLAQVTAERHVETCPNCNAEDWQFLLAVSPRTPKNTEFDIEGNVKP